MDNNFNTNNLVYHLLDIKDGILNNKIMRLKLKQKSLCANIYKDNNCRQNSINPCSWNSNEIAFIRYASAKSSLCTKMLKYVKLRAFEKHVELSNKYYRNFHRNHNFTFLERVPFIRFPFIFFWNPS